MLDCIMANCANSRLAVSNVGCHGDFHLSELGVKQGCLLSPMLFGLYVDGLLKHLKSTCLASASSSMMDSVCRPWDMLMTWS